MHCTCICMDKFMFRDQQSVSYWWPTSGSRCSVGRGENSLNGGWAG
jgi:hypothetical protein